MIDKREIKLYQGLNQLNNQDLQKLIDFINNGGEMIYDEFNYDKGLF